MQETKAKRNSGGWADKGKQWTLTPKPPQDKNHHKTLLIPVH